MQIVPLKAVPSQTLNISLSGQSCTLNIYQKLIDSPVLFMDLFVAGTLILSGITCRNAAAIVRNTYFGFTGDFAFYDTQGTTDPTYTGLGARYILAYLSPGDLPGSTVQTLAAG